MHGVPRVVLTFALLASCGRGGQASDATVGDASTTDAAPDAALRNYVPFIDGDFGHVYTPPGTNYLNDHTLIRGSDGTWHLYGITNPAAAAPQNEVTLLHATAPSLDGPWTDQPDVLTADPNANERVLWAPYVFARGADTWTMYYWGDWIQPETPMRGIRRADSTDLVHFVRTESGSMPSIRPPGGRDPMALEIAGRWFLYSVGVDANSHGEILVSTNGDLDDPNGWSDAVPVITDPVASYGWGNLESPFVVPYGGQFYLFLTRTADDSIDYVRTDVFRSPSPTHFEFTPITTIRSHAAEIVVDEAGRYYITSAGWTEYVGDANRGLLIAPLGWAPE